MGKIIITLLLLVMSLTTTASASVYDIMVNGLCYNYHGCCYLKLTYQYTPTGGYINYSHINGALTIPDTVTYNGKEYPVRSIGDNAFTGCTGLTSVVIPDAYWMKSIGFEAFLGCTGLTSVSISNSINSIGVRAFKNCSNLSSVIIPNSVNSIGKGAFIDCTNLTSVTIGSIVQNDYEYNDTIHKMENIFGPNVKHYIIDGAYKIGNHEFVGCSGMSSVTIPSSVTSIGKDAFSGCSGLNSVNISDLVAWCNIDYNIGNAMGQDSDGNSNPLYYAHNLYLNGTLINNLVIPDKVTDIKDGTFINCKSLISVTIPNSVTSIGWSAFNGCTGLTSVTIPNTVTSIGDKAFVGCSNLDSVTINSNSVLSSLRGKFGDQVKNYIIGESVSRVGQKAFLGCYGMTSVTIPSSLKEVGLGAFANCYNLTDVYISDIAAWCNIDWYSPEQYNWLSFASSPFFYAQNLFLNGELVVNLEIPNTVEIIKPLAFYGCNCLGSVIIPNSVTSIGESSFSHCSSLTSVTIPNSVISIGESSFSHCSSLTSVTIPNSVISIPYGCFTDCTGLTSVTIGNSVTSIGESAFHGCTGLTSVTIPNSVTSIGECVFYNNNSLKNIYTDIDPSKVTLGDRVFWNVPTSTCILHVKPEYVNLFKTADQWKDFYNIVGDYSAINTVEVDSSVKEPVGYYDMNGVMHSTSVKGVNVVKYNDGTTEKILMNP